MTGEQLRKLRLLIEVKLSTLRLFTGCSLKTISDLENGREIEKEAHEKIEKALINTAKGIINQADSIEQFLEGVNE